MKNTWLEIEVNASDFMTDVFCELCTNYDTAAEFERIAERIEDAAEELTEDAARAVGNTVDGLIEAERDYHQSAEFWHEWYSDGDERFTRDGERI